MIRNAGTSPFRIQTPFSSEFRFDTLVPRPRFDNLQYVPERLLIHWNLLDVGLLSKFGVQFGSQDFIVGFQFCQQLRADGQQVAAGQILYLEMRMGDAKMTNQSISLLVTTICK